MTEAFNMDCMEAMKRMPDNAFDLAIVDPPYGIGCLSMTFTKEGSDRKFGKSVAPKRDYKRIDNWDVKPGKEYFDELFRVSKKQIIWGGNYFADMLPVSRSYVVWDKRCKDSMTNAFADCEMAWLSPGMGVPRMFRFVWNGMLQGDMKHKQQRIHPTEKPIALYRWLLATYARPDDRILDTHLGSGSSRIAAWEGGYNFVGYEIDKDYFDAQEKRFKEYSAQATLFSE